MCTAQCIYACVYENFNVSTCVGMCMSVDTCDFFDKCDFFLFFFVVLCARICAHHTRILHGCALCMHNARMTVSALREYRALSWKDRALLRADV